MKRSYRKTFTKKRTLSTRKRLSKKARSGVNSQRYKTWLGAKQSSAYAGVPSVQASKQYLSKMNPFPSGRVVTFKYCETVIVSSLTTTPNCGNEYAFSLNSLFDPNITGTGHQPYLYDQIANVYRKYRVFSCDVLLTFYFPNSTTQSVLVQVVNSQDSSTLTAANTDEASERTGAFWCPIDPEGNNTITYQDSIKIWELEGMSYDEWIADTGFAANYNASPAANSKIKFAVADAAAPVTASSISCRVELIYKARMYEPLTVGQS